MVSAEDIGGKSCESMADMKLVIGVIKWSGYVEGFLGRHLKYLRDLDF
jgi:hypothetical protein